MAVKALVPCNLVGGDVWAYLKLSGESLAGPDTDLPAFRNQLGHAITTPDRERSVLRCSVRNLGAPLSYCTGTGPICVTARGSSGHPKI